MSTKGSASYGQSHGPSASSNVKFVSKASTKGSRVVVEERMVDQWEGPYVELREERRLRKEGQEGAWESV